MLQAIESHVSLFKSWTVIAFEHEGDTYLLKITAVLKDNSLLEIRDYLFADGNRKYAYQWMEKDGKTRCRWDNAPHWDNVSTFPHHMHLPDQEAPLPSTITNIVKPGVNKSSCNSRYKPGQKGILRHRVACPKEKRQVPQSPQNTDNQSSRQSAIAFL